MRLAVWVPGLEQLLWEIKGGQALSFLWFVDIETSKLRSCDVWTPNLNFPWCILEDSPSLDSSSALKYQHRAHLATTKKETVASGETQEDNQNFNWKADMKNSD